MKRVYMTNPEGELHTVAEGEVQQALQSGWKTETYGGLEARKHPIQAGLEGAARGATFGLSDVAAKVLGVDTDAMERRRTRNPVAETLGQIAGGVVGGIATGGALAATGVAAKLGVGGLKFALAEGALQGAGAEVSDATLEDRELSAERLAVNSLIGAAAGGTLHGVGKAVMAGGRYVKDKVALLRFGEKATELGDEYITNAVGAQSVARELGFDKGATKKVADFVVDEDIIAPFNGAVDERAFKKAASVADDYTQAIRAKLDTLDDTLPHLTSREVSNLAPGLEVPARLSYSELWEASRALPKAKRAALDAEFEKAFTKPSEAFPTAMPTGDELLGVVDSWKASQKSASSASSSLDELKLRASGLDEYDPEGRLLKNLLKGVPEGEAFEAIKASPSFSAAIEELTTRAAQSSSIQESRALSKAAKNFSKLFHEEYVPRLSQAKQKRFDVKERAPNRVRNQPTLSLFEEASSPHRAPPDVTLVDAPAPEKGNRLFEGVTDTRPNMSFKELTEKADMASKIANSIRQKVESSQQSGLTLPTLGLFTHGVPGLVAGIAAKQAGKQFTKRGEAQIGIALRHFGSNKMLNRIATDLHERVSTILRVAPDALGAFRYPLEQAVSAGTSNLLGLHSALASGPHADKYLTALGYEKNSTPQDTLERISALASIEQSNQMANDKIDAAVKSALSGKGVGQVRSLAPKTGSNTVFGPVSPGKLEDELKTMQQTLQNAENIFQEFYDPHAPSVGNEAAATKLRAMQFLLEKAPKNPVEGQNTIFRKKWNPAVSEVRDWNQLRAVVSNPEAVLANGLRNPMQMEHLQAIESVYPKMLENYRLRVTQALLEDEEKQRSMSSKQRQALEVLMGSGNVYAPQEIASIQQATTSSSEKKQGGKVDGRQSVSQNKNMQTQAQRLEGR